jgi:hypothetical protein
MCATNPNMVFFFQKEILCEHCYNRTHTVTYSGDKHYIFPRFKYLMLFSKMSQTAVLHLHYILLPSSVAGGKFDDDDVDATVDRGLTNEVLDATLVHLDGADSVVSVYLIP